MPNTLFPAAATGLPTPRRQFLAGLLAAPIAVGAGVAAATDPVFQLIEAHREPFRLLCDACTATDTVVARREGREITLEDQAAYVAADGVETLAFECLLETAPHTVAGVRAVIAHLAEYDSGCAPEASGRYLQTLLRSPVLQCRAGEG